METLLPKISQIFEYLHAIKSLHERIIRSVHEYEKVWWQSDLPNVEGCYINGNGKKEEAWLEVHKQEIPPTPALPQVLHEWILKWNDPMQEPSYLKTRSDNIKEEYFEDDLFRLSTYHSWIEEECVHGQMMRCQKRKCKLSTWNCLLYISVFSAKAMTLSSYGDMECLIGE